MIVHRVKSQRVHLSRTGSKQLAFIQNEHQITLTVYATDSHEDGSFVLHGIAILPHPPQASTDAGIRTHEATLDQATVDKIEIAQPFSLFLGKVDWVIFQDSPQFESKYRAANPPSNQTQA